MTHRIRWILLTAIFLLAGSGLAFADGSCPSNADLASMCPRVVTADVVALDQFYYFNRLGASQPNGQVFALRSDVVCQSEGDDAEASGDARCSADHLTPGKVMLRQDKRPRPMVLRVAEGDCLRIEFENLLAPGPSIPATREAGVHVGGLSLVAACAVTEDGVDDETPAIDADASFVGVNDSSLASPGDSRTYVYKAEQEGTYLMNSTGAMAGLIFGNGQVAAGLHGLVNVEPPGAVFFRSQVTRDDLLAANRRDDCPYPLTSTDDGDLCLTPHGQPLLDYWAEDEEGRPILAMLDRDTLELTSTDLTALIAYQDPDRVQPGPFPYDPDNPLCFAVPASGAEPPETRCTRPFREISIIYEEPLASTSQSLDCLTSGNSNAVEQLGTWDAPQGGTTTITLPPDGDLSGLDGTPGIVTASQSTCPEDWNLTPYLKDIFSANGSLDSFGINYGMDAIGPRVLANRVRIGPQADCVGCKYEEFFLSSWPNGDPAQVSTNPAGLNTAGDFSGDSSDSSDDSVGSTSDTSEAILYPDDPSNVYHSYLGDPVKYRIASAGGAAAHVHHQHAHQWLHTPNASAGHYLDSQTLTPGATYTLEMVYDGSGNRNETVGDSIFHCHFYPHFASGMWSLWRVHDVYESGTKMDAATQRPVSSWDCRDGEAGNAGNDCRLVTPNRALPDPVIAEGTPIPAVVPLPNRALPPMPAPVALSPDGKRGLTLVRQEDGWGVLGGDPTLDDVLGESTPRVDPVGEVTAELAREIGNPGYPFFIPGVAGQRAVRPPMDVPEIEHEGRTLPLDGGLPRHRIGGSPELAGVPISTSTDGCTETVTGNSFRECHTRHDFSKILLDVQAEQLDENGEPAERLAMLWHGGLFRGGRVPSCGADGVCDEATTFRLNGSPPEAGAPYADPCALEDQWNGQTRQYKAAAIQTDVVLTKEGWHFPQQRMLSLWDDVAPTLAGERTPEPLFFRANSGECIDFWHSNLVPSEYALDDYQVRTPTDIIGQHIHLVKFDVTSSDGAANGFNYEDATLSPDEVRERIDAINAGGGLRVPAGQTCPDGTAPTVDGDGGGRRCLLEARELPFFGPGPGGRWLGAMATVQRWMADPLEDVYGTDRTIRTVFTHDHMSPSTHQQTGLYAGLLVEPACSQWVDSWTGEVMGGSLDPLDPDCQEVYAARPSDGGPTSWRANILYADDPTGSSYEPGDADVRLVGVREFALEFQDLSLVYPRSTQLPPSTLALENICPTCPGPSTGAAIGPSSISNKFNYGVDFPRAVNSAVINAPNGPWPQAVTFGAMFGIYSVNYRSEPLFPRVTAADGSPPPATGARVAAQDLAQVYRSIERENPELNVQPSWYPPLTGGAQGTDPLTPLLEVYAGDRVQIRTLTGAHFLNHQFVLRGLPWLFEPSLANSGYRAAQSTSLSEHFEMNVRIPRRLGAESADFLYQTDLGDQGQAKGAWGLMRAYAERQDFLEPLPDNEPLGPDGYGVESYLPGSWVCSPASREGRDGFTTRRYRVLALDSASFAPGTPLPYRSPVDLTLQVTLEDSGDDSGSTKVEVPLRTAVESPEAVIYVHADDVEWREGAGGEDGAWHFRPGIQAEPLVLRAAAGDCLEVTLENHVDPLSPAFVTANPSDEPLEAPVLGSPQCTDEQYLDRLAQVQSGTDPSALDGYAELCAGSFAASTRVGLAPQLVAYDPLRGAGYDAGFNPTQTVPARSGDAEVPSRTYLWYAGHVETDEEGRHHHTPVEFGAANLLPADPFFQATKGLFGALVIEPRGATWVEDANTRLQATVYPATGEPFREGVLVLQDDLELYFRDENDNYQALNVGNVANFSGQTTAVGYGSESPLLRMSPPAQYDIQVNAPDDPEEPQDPQQYGTLFLTDLADQSCWLSSAQAGRDPSTTMLTAHAGTPYRVRLVHTLGNFTSQTFVLHGHGWQEEPYVPLEGRRNVGGYAGPGPVPQTIGPNPYSQWLGSQGGVGAGQHFDLVLEPAGDGAEGLRHNGAGGQFKVPGDYLYRTWQSNGFIGGTWGLFRVGPEVPVDAAAKSDIVRILTAHTNEEGGVTIVGSNSSILGSKPGERRFAGKLWLYSDTASDGSCAGDVVASRDLEPPTGPTRTWSWSVDLASGDTACVRSDAGGVDSAVVVDQLPCPASQTTSSSGSQQANGLDPSQTIERAGGQTR